VTKTGIFIRHGESTANSTGVVSHDLEGYPLTEKGRKQANHTGQVLSELKDKIDNIVVSPLQRTIQTAEEVMLGMGYSGKYIMDNDLRETFLGPYNNGPVSALPKIHSSKYGIEPFEENGERLFRCAIKYEGLSIFVSHNLPIKALVCKLMNLHEEDAGGIDIKNASMTAIDFDNLRILSIGSLRISEELLKRLSSR